MSNHAGHGTLTSDFVHFLLFVDSVKMINLRKFQPSTSIVLHPLKIGVCVWGGVGGGGQVGVSCFLNLSKAGGHEKIAQKYGEG